MPPAPAATGADSSLRTRLKSALVFAPVVLALIWWGGWPFVAMMGAGAFVAMDEAARLSGGPFSVRLRRLSSVFAAFAVFAVPFGLGAPALMAGLAALFFIGKIEDGPSMKLFLSGFIYVAAAMMVMTALRTGGESGLFHTLTVLLIVWASDVCAYATGRSLGGPKLAPRISPKKTWSGFLGSSFGAGAVAAILAASPWGDGQTLGGWGWQGYFILGFFLAMAGQAGDLLVSFFKRRQGVKDTGTLIPGHGGLLDRIDALLLVALVFGLLVAVWG